MNQQTLELMATNAFENAKAARDELYKAAENAIVTNEALEVAKAEAALSGKIDGKNAEIREAQIRSLLADQYEAVTIVTRSERAARYKFDKAQLDVDAIKTLLRIAELP